MLFTEPTFLFVFLPILLALYQLPGVHYRNWLLLAASIIFYTRGAGNFTWLVLALTVVRALARRPTRVDLALLALRAAMTPALVRGYRPRGIAQYLSPLADPLVAVRLTQAALRPERTWRGRVYAGRGTAARSGT